MAKTRDYMDYLDEQVEIAPANSQEEYQAASTIADLMRDHGLAPKIEEFEAYSWGKLLPAIVVIVMFICLVVTGVTEGVPHVITLIVAIAGVAALLVSHFLRDVFETLGPTKRSQNVVAVHRASGDKVVKGARPIVIVAHYDTPRVSLLRKGPLARMQAALWSASIACAIVVAVCLFVQILVFLPPILRMALWVIGIIAALPLLFLAVVTIIDNFGACTIGANDNKSAVAAMLSIMNKVCPSEDRVDGVFRDEAPVRRRESDPEPEPAAPVRREVVEEVMGVRHGRDILSDLRILPASCELVYEMPKVKIVEEYEEEFAAPAEMAESVDTDLEEQEFETWEDEDREADESFEPASSDDYDAREDESFEDGSYYEDDEEDWEEDWEEDQAPADEEEQLDAEETDEAPEAADEEYEDEAEESEDENAEPVQSSVRSSRLHRVLPLVDEEEEEYEDEAYDEDFDEDDYEEDYEEDYDGDYEEDYEEYEDEGHEEGDEDDEGSTPAIVDRLKSIWAAICAFFVGIVAKVKGLFSKKNSEEDELLEDDEDFTVPDDEGEEYSFNEYEDEDLEDEEYSFNEYEDEDLEDEYNEYIDEDLDEQFEEYEEYEQDFDLEAEYADDQPYEEYFEEAEDQVDSEEYDEQADELALDEEQQPAMDDESEYDAYAYEADDYDYDDGYEEDVIAQGGYEQAPVAPAQAVASDDAYDEFDDQYLEDEYYDDDQYEDAQYDDEQYDDEYAVLEEDYQDEGSYNEEPAGQYGEPVAQDDSYYDDSEEEYEGYAEDFEGEYEEEPVKQSLSERIKGVFRKIGGRAQREDNYIEEGYDEEADYLEGEEPYEDEAGSYDQEGYEYEEYEEYESVAADDSDQYVEEDYEGEYEDEEYGYEEEYGEEEYDEYDSYADRVASMHPADPNELHFDREEDSDIVPRDTTGLDTISETYDLIPQEPVSAERREPPASIDDPNWGVSSYRHTPPSRNFARRAVLFDLPDPSSAELDPLASDDYYDEPRASEEGAYNDSYETSTYEDDYYGYDDPSLDDIMEESRNFTDRESARRAASSEQADRRESDTRDNQSRSFWKGGASMRADLRDGDEPIYIDEADLQDAILEMGDDFLQGHDVWFVATGASSLGHAGIKAFLNEHRRDIRGSFLINMEAIGAGSLSLLVSEGLHAPRRADRRLVRMLKDIAGDLHIDLDQAVRNWDETDAASSMRSRIRSVTITGLDENDLPALSRTEDDVPQNVNPDMVSSVVRLVTELIRRA